MGLFRGVETKPGYRPSYFHRLFRRRTSGSAINGLGKSQRRWPSPVYHDQTRRHPWRIVQDAFYVRVTLRGFWRFVISADRLDRRPPAPISAVRTARPEVWTKRVKDKALELGFEIVGLTRMEPEWEPEGDEVRDPWIVISGSLMDYERLSKAAAHDYRVGLGTVMETYPDGHRRAVALAYRIRSQGWHTRGFGSRAEPPPI